MRKKGGDITLIAGNHDDFAFAYLTGKDIPGMEQ
jgi:hypothetical protein